MCHLFSKVAVTGNSLILESNFHETELKKYQKKDSDILEMELNVS